MNKKQLTALVEKHGGLKATSDAEDFPLSSLYDLAAELGVSVTEVLNDPEEFAATLDYCGSWQAMGRFTGIAVSTLKNRGARMGIKSPRSGPGAPKPISVGSAATRPSAVMPIANETSNVTEDRKKGTASAEYVDAIPATMTPEEAFSDEELLKRANRDPKVWEVTNYGTSTWNAQKDGEVFNMRSLRVTFGKTVEAKLEQIFPSFKGAPLTIKQPKRDKRNRNRTNGRLVVIMSDFHAPFHDRRLLSAAKQALLESQPDELVINGDIVDWPNLRGKTMDTLDCQATANHCIQAAGDILVGLKSSVPEDCKLVFIPGNHDGWLARYIVQKGASMAGIKQHDGDNLEVHSLRHLLRLKEKGYEMIGKEDRWSQATYKLAPRLVVWHGDATQSGAGASALKNMEMADFATITGHTHRQAIVPRTIYDADRRHKLLQGAECGAMLKMPETPDDWPTYRAHTKLNWQTGFVSVWVEDDGHYVIETASWQNRVLMWHGKRYEPAPDWDAETDWYGRMLEREGIDPANDRPYP